MTDPYRIVASAVAEIGNQTGYEALSSVAPETESLGGEAGIDSLTVVLIVAEIERVAEQEAGKPIVLADERAMSRKHSPFRTVGALTELLGERLRE